MFKHAFISYPATLISPSSHGGTEISLGKSKGNMLRIPFQHTLWRVHSTGLQYWNRMEADGTSASRSPYFLLHVLHTKKTDLDWKCLKSKLFTESSIEHILAWKNNLCSQIFSFAPFSNPLRTCFCTHCQNELLVILLVNKAFLLQ